MRPWSRVRLRPLEYSAPDKRPTHPSGMIGTPLVPLVYRFGTASVGSGASHHE